MDLKLNNKVAVVLAASKGLGRAIATTLSAEGAKVIIGSRNADELNKTASEIQQLTGNEVIAIPVDVSKSDDRENFITQAAAKFGRIDILLNNAGGPPFDKFENFDEQAWQKAFDLNLLSVAHLSRLALPYLKKSGNGRLINIISGSVKIGTGKFSTFYQYAHGHCRNGKTNGRRIWPLQHNRQQRSPRPHPNRSH